MATMVAIIQPTQPQLKVLTLKPRITVNGLDDTSKITITDLILQAGTTVTGWIPHVTELPWSAGIVAE